ncbi:MAG: SDR family oxidoreductase, partial [Deltaproteobacteria bacterium]|nr:SDR family oxidoreductase [Deltaproteobacteria bacterium]
MTREELEQCLRILETLVEDRRGLAELDLETRNRFLTAAGRLSRPERTEQRLLARELGRRRRRADKAADEAALSQAGIRKLREQPVFITPEPLLRAAVESGSAEASDEPPGWEAPELRAARSCYVCKAPRDRLHFFYDHLCLSCGDFNYRKRTQTADLRGRTALVSGARVKIGYQAGILLLRAGARVVVTTRFPRDAALRYSREPDFESFRDRLVVYGLDLRHTPSVEAFARHLTESEPRLDFVIHNACQTVRRPAGFYRHLLDVELGSAAALPPAAAELVHRYERLRAPALPSGEESSATRGVVSPDALGIHAAAALSQAALTPEDADFCPTLFPEGQLDQDLQQVDLREVNSWRLPLDRVGTVELLEVQLVNAIAPFVLNARLRPLLARERTFDKHIVNVSAMEGQFYRRFKTDKHPHTNMAKAALNMMTRTSAADYARDGIYMNSVDTGWVTDEDPAAVARRKAEETGFTPPLDIVDGAARICDPIFDGINTGNHRYG